VYNTVHVSKYTWQFVIFFVVPFLILYFRYSDSLGPRPYLTCMPLLLNSLNTDVRAGFSAFIPSFVNIKPLFFFHAFHIYTSSNPSFL